MGRREDRELTQATWDVLEPRVPGTPFRKKDIADSTETRQMQVQPVDRALLRRIARAVAK